MSSSEIQPTFKLSVDADLRYRGIVKLTVFDGFNQVVNSENRFSPFELSLPKGLYSLRMELAGETKTVPVILDASREFHIGTQQTGSNNAKQLDPPELATSAVFQDSDFGVYKTTHEYYSDPVKQWSSHETFNYKSRKKKRSSLFIFLRFLSYEHYQAFKSKSDAPFYADFTLYSRYGKVVNDFKKDTGIEKDDANSGWLAFNADLPDGLYFLQYNGTEERQIPIYLYKNWHTQVFLTLSSQPLFGSLRIFLARKKTFDSSDVNNKYLDIFLNKLQNNDYSLTSELIHVIAREKFQAPMLGLLGAYLYLQSGSTANDGLFRQIVSNLQDVILSGNDSAPDLRALNILSAKYIPKSKVKKSAVEGTPMYRVGFEAIRKASAEYSRLIKKGSLNDYITENLYCDSPFNTFKPIAFEKEPTPKPKKPRPDELERITALKILELPTFKHYTLPVVSASDGKTDKTLKNILGDNVLSFIKTSADDTLINDSWVKSSMWSMLNEDENLTVKDLSQKLEISGSTVTRIIQEWKSDAKKHKL